jgi:hypothetical protein
MEKMPPLLAEIVLTTTALDIDGDGVPEVPADGKSAASVRVSLLDAKGMTLMKSVEVHFRTTAGTLSQREVMTDRGKATVELISSRETVTAFVYAFAEGFKPDYLKFEFVNKRNKNTREKRK